MRFCTFTHSKWLCLLRLYLLAGLRGTSQILFSKSEVVFWATKKGIGITDGTDGTDFENCSFHFIYVYPWGFQRWIYFQSGDILSFLQAKTAAT